MPFLLVSSRNEEIVMPAEHTGLVKENYIWKVTGLWTCTTTPYSQWANQCFDWLWSYASIGFETWVQANSHQDPEI